MTSYRRRAWKGEWVALLALFHCSGASWAFLGGWRATACASLVMYICVRTVITITLRTHIVRTVTLYLSKQFHLKPRVLLCGRFFPQFSPPSHWEGVGLRHNGTKVPFVLHTFHYSWTVANWIDKLQIHNLSVHSHGTLLHLQLLCLTSKATPPTTHRTRTSGP